MRYTSTCYQENSVETVELKSFHSEFQFNIIYVDNFVVNIH